jgi:chemotaxis protein CheX
VQLAEILDLNAAEPLRQALVERRGAPVVLDGSNVGRLGGLCLQVLISAQKTWAEDGYDFRLERCSTALLEQLRLLGAADLSADSFHNDALGARA